MWNGQHPTQGAMNRNNIVTICVGASINLPQCPWAYMHLCNTTTIRMSEPTFTNSVKKMTPIIK